MYKHMLNCREKRVRVMTVRHMRIFCAVCENDCSTTKAAAQLNMSQPAVSLAVKELENYYEVRLV